MKLNRKAEKRKLDIAFAKYVVRRDKCCITCGKTTTLQCSHFFGRRSSGTRWDIQNCNAQCAGCHLQYHNLSPMPYTRSLIERIGTESFERLEQKSNSPIKVTAGEMVILRKYFEEK